MALALAGLALSAGCRDLVTPEAALNNGHPDLQLSVLGLGNDDWLVEARVRIDNSAYVDPVQAASAETLTVHLGLATFEEMSPGLYDIDIETRSFRHGTPPWSEKGVFLGDSLAVVAYEGIESAVTIDWPLLDEIAPGSYGTILLIGFRGPPDSEYWRGEQRFHQDADGVYRGALPWEGKFECYLGAHGPGFDVEWISADSIPLAENGETAVASPLRRRAMELRFGSDPVAAHQVRIQQQGSGPGYASLQYPLDRRSSPDSVIVALAEQSTLTVGWADGPAFLDRRVWLGEDSVVLAPIDLGPHRLDLSVTGPGGEALAATVSIQVDTRAGSFSADESGRLQARLHPGRHRVSVSHAGYRMRDLFVDVDGDLDLDVQLERDPG